MSLFVISFLFGLLAVGNVGAEPFRTVCYYSSWAHKRPELGKFSITDIDPSLCSHIIYLYAKLNPTTAGIEVLNYAVDIDFFSQLARLKEKSCSLKTLIGWGSLTSSEVETMALLLQNTSNFDTFAHSLTDFCYRYQFDGVDINLETLKDSVTPEQVIGLLDAIKGQFLIHKFTLSVTLSAKSLMIHNRYNVAEMGKLVDFLNVMTLDFHSPAFDVADYHAPFQQPGNLRTFVGVINDALSVGLDKSRLNAAVPSYGRSFKLGTHSRRVPPVAASGPGLAGLYTESQGILSFYEICLRVRFMNWDSVCNASVGAYAFSDTQWVSYDDNDVTRHKVKYVIHNKLGGIAVWDITMDDFKNVCGLGKFPLLNTISEVYRAVSGPPVNCTKEKELLAVNWQALLDNMSAGNSTEQTPTANNSTAGS